MTPKAKARQTIDALLVAEGWYVWNVADAMQVFSVVEVGHHPPIVREAEVDPNLRGGQGPTQACGPHRVAPPQETPAARPSGSRLLCQTWRYRLKVLKLPPCDSFAFLQLNASCRVRPGCAKSVANW